MDLEAEPYLFKIFSSNSSDCFKSFSTRSNRMKFRLPPEARRHFLPCLYICILVASLLVSSPGSSGGGPGEPVSRLHDDKFFDPWNMTCEGAEQLFSANLVIYLTSIRRIDDASGFSANVKYCMML